MKNEDSQERLLPNEPDSQAKSDFRIQVQGNRYLRAPVLATFFCLLLLSLSYNLYFLVTSQKSQSSSNVDPTSLRSTSYSGLDYDKPVVYNHHTDYWGSNATLADELWENIDTDPMVVALTDDFALGHGLPLSNRFVWDHNKGRYFLKVFHQLHCLKYIRRYVTDIQRHAISPLDGTHVHHCLDTLRQDVTCRADDTPMPSSPGARVIGNGQKLMCRDMDKLVAWSYAPERHACHRSLDEYRPITHPMERYAFCPDDSRYHGRMTEFFEKHGHRDPYE